MNPAAGSSVGSAHRIVPKRPFDSKPIRFTKTERLRLRAAGANAPAPCQNHCAEVLVPRVVHSDGYSLFSLIRASAVVNRQSALA